MSALSARELLTEAVAKTNALTTVRIEMEQLIEHKGEVQEKLIVGIRQVGGNSYVARSTELRVNGRWQGLRNRSSERLFYEGEWYARSVSGRWEPEWLDGEASVGAYLLEGGTKRQSRRTLPYGIDFADVNQLHRSADGILDGVPVVHLTGSLNRRPIHEISQDAVDAISSLPAGNQIIEHLQDSSSPTSVDIWIGAEDHLLRQFVVREELLEKGKAAKRTQMTVRLSEFDEDLQLPGPLPES